MANNCAILTISRSEVNAYVQKYSQHWNNNRHMLQKERLRRDHLHNGPPRRSLATKPTRATTRKTTGSTPQTQEIDLGPIATVVATSMYMMPGPVAVAVTQFGPTVEAQGRGLGHYHRFFTNNTRGEACIDTTQTPQLYIEA